MLNTAGLDLANTPPIGLSLRFFLAAPLFALAAGVLLATGAETALLSRWTPTALATTHLLLLGFITPIMCGALLQILPVLVGVRSTVTAQAGAAMVIMLGLGAALLSSGLGLGHNGLLLAGAVLAAAVLLAFVFNIVYALFASPGSSPVRWTLTLAVSALAVTVMFGLLLVGSRSGWLNLAAGKAWTDIHLAWGLAGWMGLLLAGIAGELIPMFYLSPPPPTWLKRGLPMAIIGLLVLWPMTALLSGNGLLSVAITMGILLLLGGFAVTSFVSQWRRRRPRHDPSLGFWWLGQSAILMAAAAWLLDEPETLIGVLAIIGSGMSFTTGTLFKIVPFLSWYHLQTCKVKLRRTDIKLPTMQGFIGDRIAGWQLAIHSSALLFLSLGTWLQTPTIRVGGLLLAGSALLLWFSLARAWWRYRRIRRQLLSGNTKAAIR